MTAPETMWAPTAEPFSTTTTDSSLPASVGELLQADRRRQTGRAGTDDDDVELHRLSGRQLGCGVDLGLGHRLFEPLISRELR